MVFVSTSFNLYVFDVYDKKLANQQGKGSIEVSLEENTTYYYQWYTENGWSEMCRYETKSFTDHKALVIGDIQIGGQSEESSVQSDVGYNWNNVLAKALQDNPDVSYLVSPGDNTSTGKTADEWQTLLMPKAVRSLPMALAIGNHDKKGMTYNYYTNMPNEFYGKYFEGLDRDFWFRHGDVLYLVFDACSASAADHMAMAKEAVEANPDAKWIIAVMHHDMFGGREAWLETENKLLRMLWTPFFDEFGVDLCLYGHSHYYSVSNVIYGRKNVTETGHNAVVTDAAGTVYLSSGSVNHLAPLLTDEGQVPPVGENAGYVFLEEEMIYNLMEFSDDTLTVKSYTVDSDELFNTLTLEKTSAKGGHVYKNSAWYLKGLAKFAGTIVNIINNYDMYKRYINDGYDVSIKQGLIGS